MKKIIVLTIVLAINIWAVNVHQLEQAHVKALEQYSQDFNATQAFITLQLAGIKEVYDKQPKGMSKGKYVQLLNDFAYWRYKSTELKKQTRIVRGGFGVGNGTSYIGDESIAPYDDIKNATMRLNRLCEAKRLLQRVIHLDPDRAVAYLNLGDVYWEDARLTSKFGYQEAAVRRILHCKKSDKEPKEIFDLFHLGRYPSKERTEGFESQEQNSRVDFFKAHDMYRVYSQKMKEQGKEEQISKRITDLLQRRYYYIVTHDDEPLNGDASVCAEYEKGLQSLSDKEIDQYGNSPNGRGDIAKYNPKFTRMPFNTLPQELQKEYRRYGRVSISEENPVLAPKRDITDLSVYVYLYKEDIYYDTRQGWVYILNNDPQVIKNYGDHPMKCWYDLIDFEQKIVSH